MKRYQQYTGLLLVMSPLLLGHSIENSPSCSRNDEYARKSLASSLQMRIKYEGHTPAGLSIPDFLTENNVRSVCPEAEDWHNWLDIDFCVRPLYEFIESSPYSADPLCIIVIPELNQYTSMWTSEALATSFAREEITQHQCRKGKVAEILTREREAALKSGSWPDLHQESIEAIVKRYCS